LSRAASAPPVQPVLRMGRTRSPRSMISAHTLAAGLKKVLPAGALDWIRPRIRRLRGWRADVRVSRSPDRIILTESIFPALVNELGSRTNPNVLWIGCRRYTKPYCKMLEFRGAICWTIDIDPLAAQWGHTRRHRTGNVLALEEVFADRRFDAVLCNGVLGWGVDSLADQRSALKAIAAVTKPGDWLILGWNTDRIRDPVETKVTAPWFARAVLPGFGERYVCAGCTHVYDVFRTSR